MFLIFGLGLTAADSSAVSVHAGSLPIPVENVGPLTALGLSATYVIVVLPENLTSSPMDFPLIVTVRGVATSNSPLLSISGP
jgi:hypothetical protein